MTGAILTALALVVAFMLLRWVAKSVIICPECGEAVMSDEPVFVTKKGIIHATCPQSVDRC